MRILLIIAAAGLVASCFVHFSTFLGVNPLAVGPAVFILHVLIVLVVLPVVVVHRKFKGKGFDELTRYAPSWMKRMCWVFFLYAFFNFFFTGLVLSKGGTADVMDGRKVLENRGKIIKELTEEEFQRYQGYDARAYSGHWMFFYGLGTVVFYSYLRGANSSKRIEGDLEEAGRASL